MLNVSRNKIAPTRDEAHWYSLEVLQTPHAGRILARWLIGILVAVLVIMLLPWQQNVQGKGKITALSPQNRPQTVQSVIPGQISSWRVQEGMFVSKGDTLLVLGEIKNEYFDPEVLQRKQEQLAAKEGSLKFKLEKADALIGQIAALEVARELKVEQARNKLAQAYLKVTTDSAAWAAEQVNLQVAQAQLDRQEQLFEQGLVKLTDLEKRRLKFQEVNAKLVSAFNKYNLALNERINAELNISTLQAEFADKLSKAQSDLAATRADAFESEGEVAKLENEVANLTVRQGNYYLLAPQAGRIVKALKAGIGETVKEGEALVTIMPETPDVAVELYVQAMDLPLLKIGRNVRLEFDGWPGFQFSGWPNASVGTFGGLISVIDYVAQPDGSYRVLVTPNPSDEEWPEQLRLGSGVFGWAMLDQVPLWYEVWRQFNGFPPEYPSDLPGAEGGDKAKTETASK
ncbi:MAG TPA: biotin attachment protein [Cytophagales bacterium]|nr:biotin attachment protein [Cytophagales bacterium]HAA22552.1 biotin attachment protein [Cytophagales bacterium]HAP60929.1 biotin attachment protein [Cytophagales bacterium]